LDGEWLYNARTTLPPEVLTQRNFGADFIRLKLNFIQKIVFEPPFRGLTGNARIPSARPWSASSSS